LHPVSVIIYWSLAIFADHLHYQANLQLQSHLINHIRKRNGNPAIIMGRCFAEKWHVWLGGLDSFFIFLPIKKSKNGKVD
jgi:hypothetical protein